MPKETIHADLLEAMTGDVSWRWYEYITIPIEKFIWNIKHSIKSRIQKLIYGFPDYEWYDFKIHTSNYIVPRLEALKNKTHSTPIGISIDEWKIILDKIIWAFKNINNQPKLIYSDNYDHRVLKIVNDNMTVTLMPLNKEGTVSFSAIEEHNKLVKEGLNLFAEHYLDLWS